MGSVNPLVSVVICTQNRPHLVGRAVQSALAQTLHALEVIVVQDGPNDATVQVLRQIRDPRLTVHVLAHNVGPPDAQNAGAAEARGRWVAFLDDDDEFLPQKLEIQLHAAQQSRYRYPIVLCRIIGRAASGDRVWPRRLPRPNEPISEWLFCRRSPFFGEGLLQTDMIFTSKRLLSMVPFLSDLRDHDDIDWLLRASAVKGAGVEFVRAAQPLAIYHMDENRGRMTQSTDWRYSLAWIQARKHLVTKRGYGSFVLTWMGSDEARQAHWDAFLPLLREAFQHGQPALIDLLSYLAHWLLPESVKRQLAAFFARYWASREPGTERGLLSWHVGQCPGSPGKLPYRS